MKIVKRTAVESPVKMFATAARAVAWGWGYLWASPNTLIGLALATLALRGGRTALVGGVLEATGGGVRELLRRLPVPGQVLAITLGHVVLSSDETTMTEARKHEHAHVRQYARWGPLFLPAYAIASLIAFARRRDPYLENAFERDAFRRLPPISTHRYNLPADGSPHGESGESVPF